MVKPLMEDETKEGKFKRIASSRTKRILNDLRLLGNCANLSVYSYTQEDANKIFNAIEREFRRIRALFSKFTSGEFEL